MYEFQSSNLHRILNKYIILFNSLLNVAQNQIVLKPNDITVNMQYIKSFCNVCPALEGENEVLNS